MICTELRNECCVCAYANDCLSGCNRNTFEPASKSEIIKRIGENKFSEDRKDMIDYLKRRYGVDYISCINDKESEDNKMLHKITVTKTEEKVLEEYYVMRGIKKQYDGLGNEKKVVCCEREVSKYPDFGTIAQFLNECGADFVSVEHNYRFEPDLPF